MIQFFKRAFVQIGGIFLIIFTFYQLINFNIGNISSYISTPNCTTKIVEKEEAATSLLIQKAIKRKYIGCYVYEAGGFGNQIWRFASLYGLGRVTGREPFFEINPFQTPFTKTDLRLMNLTEIAETFPVMHDFLHIKNPSPIDLATIDFAPNCCKFDDPKKLMKVSEKYLKITGDYLQSYKFFHSFRDEIRQILGCETKMVKKLTDFTKNLFQNDTNLKLCVHIRRGDFIPDILLESKAEFVIPSIEFAYRHFMEAGIKNLSLMFIGTDIPFVKGLNISHVGFDKIYIPDPKSRGEDLCLGIHFCDSLIMTASGSTFGWWMGYLMKNRNGTIFYNSQTTDPGTESKDVHDFDLFLPEWIMLSGAKDGSKVIRERQWWHERHGLPPDLSEPYVGI